MWFTRIWLVLLALALAVVFALALAIPRPAAREIAENNRQNLDRLQHNAELLLKIAARGWIDTVSNFSNDHSLIKILEQATDKSRDVSTLRAKANARLQSLVSQIKAGERPKLMIAVDLQGKQICRIGPGEKKLKPGVDGLIGYPVIEAALRGYQLDDSWSVDNKLFLVAAAPVISRSQGRYVGALLLGQEIDVIFANKLKAQLAGTTTHVAFFLRGAMVASTLSSKALTKLPIRYNRMLPQIDKHGRSAGFTISDGAKRYLAVMAKIPGEASAHDAFYTVLGPPSIPSAGLGTALARLKWKIDMKGFPWLMVGGIFLALALLGLMIHFVETNRPLGRLLGDLHKINQGDATRLEPRAQPGGLRHIAHVVNDLLEKQDRRAPAADKDLNRILGGPEDAATRPDLRVEGTKMPPLAADAMPPLASDDAVKPLASLSKGFSDADLPAALPLDNMLPSSPVEVRGLPEPEESPTMVDPRTPGIAGEAELPLSPMSLGPVGEDMLGATTPDGPASYKDRGGGGGAATLEPLELFEPGSGPPFSSSSAAEEEPSSLKVRVSAGGGSADPTPDRDAGVSTVMSSVPEMMAKKDQQKPEEAQFQQIYKDFLAIKQQCGESIDSVTFERFAAKLRKNRSSLMERYSCKDVKFQVYIKDGKAALKATPIKED